MNNLTKRVASVNDAGHVIGQDHHRARLTDHDVDLMRELRDDGMTLSEIASKFECSKTQVSDICAHKRRGHTTTGQKSLRPSPPRYRERRPAQPSEFA